MYLPSGFYDIFTMGRNIAGSHVLEVVSILFLHYSECIQGVQNKNVGEEILFSFWDMEIHMRADQWDVFYVPTLVCVIVFGQKLLS